MNVWLAILGVSFVGLLGLGLIGYLGLIGALVFLSMVVVCASGYIRFEIKHNRGYEYDDKLSTAREDKARAWHIEKMEELKKRHSKD